MQKQTVILFHEDLELSSLYESRLKKSNIPLEINAYENRSEGTLHSSGGRVVVLETDKENSHREVLSQTLKSDLMKTLILIGSSRVLKKTLHHIDGLSHSLQQEGTPAEEVKNQSAKKEMYIEDFLESKLTAFIKKSYPSNKKSHLYATLLQEFERPLITLALKETNGNQVQAAEILGLNRNTLRKKILALKIAVKSLKKSL